MSQVNIQEIVDRQIEAHRNNPYPSLKERAGRIKRLIGMLASNDQKICDALMKDFGNRPEITTRMAEILGTISTLKYALDNLEKWMQAEERITAPPAGEAGAKSEVEFLPLGSVGVLSPWNLPINLSFGAMGAIFAAGNRIVLKPSEITSHTSELIKTMVSESFAPEELAVVTGGADVAQAFCETSFNHILFTGSTAVGRKVAEAAGRNLVPCTLELGGKNSVVISDSADLEEAVKRIMMIRMLNGGQVCLGPDVVFIAEELQEQFIQLCKATADTFFPNMHEDPDYGQVINDHHVNRLRALIDEVQEKSAGEVVFLKNQTETPLARRFPPVIVKAPTSDTRLMKEEVFGPIISLFTYTDFDDVVERLNRDQDLKEPLALYYFGENEAEMSALRYRTQSGGLCFNTLAAHYNVEDLPFGGVGRSGTGKYHGSEGFKTFSNARAVYTQSKQDFLGSLMPPHSEKFKAHVAGMVKSVIGG